ncbi:hypothetical protein BDQ17DRAFT_1474304 [Cyathus striatus]|nr:hypothetical protein BDQ17DRAFT_1474304 [Cyathus striatus]
MVVHTGLPGQPRKRVDVTFLKEAMAPHCNITLTKLAGAMGIHCNTLCYYMHTYGITCEFSTLSDRDLDMLV